MNTIIRNLTCGCSLALEVDEIGNVVSYAPVVMCDEDAECSTWNEADYEKLIREV